MWPDFNFLKSLAAFQFPVDFKPYLDNGNIDQTEYNQLIEINKQAQSPVSTGGEYGNVN